MSFRQILRILVPRPLIGGLEISDAALKFALIKENKLTLASLNLPVGTIKEGKIKNRENLRESLTKLHAQITSRPKKKIYVVLNIPDIDIYLQVFNLPLVAVDNLEEAARLNLQMISPSDFASVYADWQKVGEANIDGGQLEVLGAFVSNKIIDEFTGSLRETNFIVAAVEFSSLAVSRLVSGLPNQTSPFLLLCLTGSGLSFSLIKNNNLYFNHFVSWPIEGERQIPMVAVQEIIIRETQKVLNFAASHWPDTQITTLFLATPALEEKIGQIIGENFPLTAQKLSLPAKLASPEKLWAANIDKLSSLGAEWFSVLGSALRGLIVRSRDTIISLASIGTEEEFRQYQIINFIKIWRNIILTSLCFILITFAALEIFLIKTVGSLNAQLLNLANLPEIEKINKLEEEVKIFNNRVDLALKAKDEIHKWSPFFEKIKNLAGENIAIERIFIQSKEMPVLFNGRAPDETAIINFKKKLAEDGQFEEINLPLAGIASGPDGKFGFSLTFRIRP